MKKIFPFAALLLAAAGSWAFYPKAAESQGYMMVVSRFTGNGFSAKIIVSTIAPDGQIQTEEHDAKTGTRDKMTNSFDQLHVVETRKLNELRQTGWRVVSSHQSTSVSLETTFVLEKQ